MRCMTCTLQQECQRDSWTDVNKKNEYKQCITVDNSTKLLYTVCNRREYMKIIINNTSMVPIYEQIMEQIKAQIIPLDIL